MEKPPIPAAEVVSILAFYRDEAIAKLAKLAKRAARYGQSIAWTATPRTEIKSVVDWHGKKKEVRVDYVDLAITGTAPSAGDFKFLATLDRQPGGVLIEAVPGVEIGDLGRTWEGRCEHCGQNRARRQAFVVEDGEGGRKIVGRSCLKDHVGRATPADLMRIFTMFRDVRGLDDEESGWGWRGRWEESTIGVIAATRAAIALWGWRPKSIEGRATAGYVNLLWEPRGDKDVNREDRERLLAELRDRGDHYEATAAAVLAWGRALNPRGDYEHNLKIALAGDVVSGKTFGLVVSASAAYDRQVAVEEKRKAEAAARPPSKWIGNVGDRITGTVTVERIVGLPDYGFGPSALYILRGDDGALISWKTQSDVWIGDKRAEVGDRAEATFTVKAHSEYRDQKETRATRAKLARITPSA